MNDSDYTLTSPLRDAEVTGGPVLALTVLWHPDPARIGEQYLDGSGDGVIELGRFMPMFSRPGKDRLPLGYGGISRQPLRIARTPDGGVAITPPDSRMIVELDGEEVGGAQQLGAERVAEGAVLGLGRAVLLCLHWATSLPRNNPVKGLLGVGSAAIMMREQVRAAAQTNMPVLLLGETGSGKEVAARAIHAMGPRAAAPLVAVNMATLNESLAAVELFGAAKGAYTGAQTVRVGLFGEADGATLFLDEIGNTPAVVQPMLLRVLESGDYRPVGAAGDRHSSARLIAATDQDLYGGAFNHALLRRLESYVIPMTPLRERREDIGVLILHFLAEGGAAADEFPFALVSDCACYDWPGNVRQLAQVVRRALLSVRMGEVPLLTALTRSVAAPQGSAARLAASAAAQGDDFAAEAGAYRGGQGRAGQGVASNGGVSPAGNGAAPPADAKRGRRAMPDHEEVLAAMDGNGWRILSAAQSLGISRPTMYKLLDEHPQIRRPERIAEEELRSALAACDGAVDRCAAQLKTPAEALRRYLGALGIS
ncbi:sigma-54-dependent transcriptional regulator [Pseudoduganella aquatica]|uniref:AAA domain-containing protein n=1 Tax=Pseudoduganella aquatica TaxID=2660641 RepID=A0A7X4HH24_9BURK|nr:sigma 54-interacting transcriptional regulator [Pseudoduganella aquatica]MYN11133.1 AAA domain-containing protein [Pseudoduganella aquatica]